MWGGGGGGGGVGVLSVRWTKSLKAEWDGCYNKRDCWSSTSRTVMLLQAGRIGSVQSSSG